MINVAETTTINSIGFIKILSNLFDTEFKYCRIVTWFHKGLFPFIEGHVGEGNERRFDIYDVTAMAFAVELYLERKNIKLASRASDRIRKDIMRIINNRPFIVIYNDVEKISFKKAGESITEELSGIDGRHMMTIYNIGGTYDQIRKMWSD